MQRHRWILVVDDEGSTERSVNEAVAEAMPDATVVSLIRPASAAVAVKVRGAPLVAFVGIHQGSDPAALSRELLATGVPEDRLVAFVYWPLHLANDLPGFDGVIQNKADDGDLLHAISGEVWLRRQRLGQIDPNEL